jgi:hypothetical protein
VFSSEPVPGTGDPKAAIDARIGRSDAVLAVIGPHWVEDAVDGNIADPSDTVRLELEAGLARGLPVIPVLTPDYELPPGLAVPASLKPLLGVQPLPLSVTYWNAAIDAIAARLKELEEVLRRRGSRNRSARPAITRRSCTASTWTRTARIWPVPVAGSSSSGAGTSSRPTRGWLPRRSGR